MNKQSVVLQYCRTTEETGTCSGSKTECLPYISGILASNTAAASLIFPFA